MNPSLNSSDLQGLSDIWKNITHPTEDQPEATPPETPEASVDLSLIHISEPTRPY